VTVNLSYEPPYGFARRMSTLDHLTGGRIGWNIVTGYLDSAAKGAGRSQQTAHDDRYAIAEDYMATVYQLWEGSWADDAVIANAATGVFAEPARVRKIEHRGPYFSIDALHLAEPSPQRTPVLYQAGTSPAGREFAARHAECIFMSGPSRKVIAPRVAAIRDAAGRLGRDPADILMFTLLTVIVAPTAKEAHARYEEYRRYADQEGALALMSGWTGVDFSKLDPDAIVQHVENDAGRTALENITRADPERVWTVREVAEHVSIGGIGPVIVGSPTTVADELEAWIDETGIDGFNLAFAVRPETFRDVVDHLIPELQKRGRYKTGYAEGTLREKLFGGSARLPDQHTGAGYRWVR
jgi:alkanesulfonate monooxygenase